MNSRLLEVVKIMKKGLGADCTYLSFSREKIKSEEDCWEEKDCLKIMFKNTNGGKDTYRIPFNKPLSTVTINDLQFAYNELMEARNGQRS